ncbi:hypothetical protein ACN28S_03130 [Cystobacter fuscus]
MATHPPPIILSFRRTFALLIVLVVLPSAGLSGFGVVAIINERAAVEKRLQAAWQGTLSALAEELPAVLRAASFKQVNGQMWLVDTQGRRLSTRDSFQLEGKQVRTSDQELAAALTAVESSSKDFPPGTSLFSLMVEAGPRSSPPSATARWCTARASRRRRWSHCSPSRPRPS